MSEAPSLASLPVGRLRQLAGEHQIPNRSRLGKDDLVSALTDLLGERVGQLAAQSNEAVQAEAAPAVAAASAAFATPTEVAVVAAAAGA